MNQFFVWATTHPEQWVRDLLTAYKTLAVLLVAVVFVWFAALLIFVAPGWVEATFLLSFLLGPAVLLARLYRQERRK